MMRLIHSEEPVIDVEDAGTTMRFLTAYFAITNKKKTVTGTERMKERPIGILVDALRTLGAEVDYAEKEGFPPIRTHGFPKQKTSTLRIRGDVSSQFISALMMVGPILPNGLKLILEGKVGSRPYIDMTAAIMKHFGVRTVVEGNEILIDQQLYRPTAFTVESDWSAASYWYAFTALATDAEVFLPRLHLDSIQGDRVIAQLMESLGVRSRATPDGQLHLTKGDTQPKISWDFTHCPDLAQTVAVVCAAKGVTGTFTGLESLRIKETDRIAALQTELKKIGAELLEQDNQWTLKPSATLPERAQFHSYKDHRMAMAFAPLATRMDVVIDDPMVVRKSYPAYWDDLRTIGFKVGG